MKLDVSSLALALTQLEKSLHFAESEQAKNDSELFEQFRNSVIQCFEFCYELSWKMLKRQIEIDAASPELVDTFSYNMLIREGAERGLLSDAENWLTYRHYCNLTSHIYDLNKAQQV